MNDFPTHVTPAQLAQVCKVLGIDGKSVTRLDIHATKGVVATILITDPDGRLVARDGDAATRTIHLPIGFPIGEQLDEGTIAQLRGR